MLTLEDIARYKQKQIHIAEAIAAVADWGALEANATVKDKLADFVRFAANLGPAELRKAMCLVEPEPPARA